MVGRVRSRTVLDEVGRVVGREEGEIGKRSVPQDGRLLLMERRGRSRLAEDAERRGRVSSTPLRGYDTTPRR